MRIKVSRVCHLCKEAFIGTYKSRYCSNAHRQAAYRRRVISAMKCLVKNNQ